jgi:phage gp46-like protein
MAAGRKTGGRVAGTPNKATADVKAAAQQYTSEAVEALAAIMRDSDSDAAKVAAIREILDRGHGKPKQSMEVDANVQAAITEIRRTIVDPRHPDA